MANGTWAFINPQWGFDTQQSPVPQDIAKQAFLLSGLMGAGNIPQATPYKRSFLGDLASFLSGMTGAYGAQMGAYQDQAQKQQQLDMIKNLYQSHMNLYNAQADLARAKPAASLGDVLKMAEYKDKQTQQENEPFYSSALMRFIKENNPEEAAFYAQGAGKAGEKYLENVLAPKEPKDAAYMDDRKYRDILARQSQGLPVSPDEKAWASAYKEQKSIGPQAYGASRLNIMLQSPQQVYNPETGETYFTTKGDINKNPGKYAGAEMGFKVRQKGATFSEIETASQQVRQALNELPGNFSQTQVAKFSNVLGANDDGSAIRNFLGTNVAKTLTPAEINYVTAVKNLRESAFALRNISGMGQGSDMLRAAIADVIPGARTPNKEYAYSSLNRFDTQVSKLRGGLPGLGKGQGTEQQNSPTYNQGDWKQYMTR